MNRNKSPVTLIPASDPFPTQSLINELSCPHIISLLKVGAEGESYKLERA
jgi:hypothetical protein